VKNRKEICSESIPVRMRCFSFVPSKYEVGALTHDCGMPNRGEIRTQSENLNGRGCFGGMGVGGLIILKWILEIRL
jgi:hypothetical protein